MQRSKVGKRLIRRSNSQIQNIHLFTISFGLGPFVWWLVAERGGQKIGEREKHVDGRRQNQSMVF
jgi:hypothetical protein